MPLASPDADAATKRTAIVRKDFNPDQPRVPAGNPDGGQWTDEGTSGESSGSSGGHGADPGAGDSEPRSVVGERVWERFPNADFRNNLAIAEHEADKPNFGYSEVNARSGALGRYQMRPNALRAAGMIDLQGKWTGKYGVHSKAQFLANPEAQERALTNLLNDDERQLRTNGATRYIGTTIDGQVAPFTVTRAGLIAAAHREGAKNTRDYLETAQLYGFVTRSHTLSGAYQRVETRLRTFADAPYE